MVKKFLFQGDSVTDAGRNWSDGADLGSGYPMFAASSFAACNPEKNVTFLNRGISGNRVRDLAARWEEDCLAIKPDVLSILIGVNDTWRRFDSDDETSEAAFEADYRKILTQTKKALPNTQIILMEPFSLPDPPEYGLWREDLNGKIRVVRRLAAEFRTDFIPLDAIFTSAFIASGANKWTADGVHPTCYGHALIAQHVLETANL